MKIGKSLKGRLKQNLIERFWEKVNIRGANECWEWQTSCSSAGYGAFSINGNMYGAHRTMWRIIYGPIPKGICVLHQCDNKKCVNPKHLFLGTHADNVRDKVNKGRQVRGEKHGQAKLTVKQVLEIRKKYVPRKYSQYKLAREYGVSQCVIKDIIIGKNWAWL